MNLARFLAEVHTRARTAIAEDSHPIWLIMSRLVVNSHTLEAKVLRKATLAVVAAEGDMAEADL